MSGVLEAARCGAGRALRRDRRPGRRKVALDRIHVACTDTWTLFHLNTKRGRVAMDAAGVLPSFHGIAIHDGLVVYRQYDRALHGLCNAQYADSGVMRNRPADGRSWPVWQAIAPVPTLRRSA